MHFKENITVYSIQYDYSIQPVIILRKYWLVDDTVLVLVQGHTHSTCYH